jgi:hypothetical protein
MSHRWGIGVLVVLALSTGLAADASARNERGPFRGQVVDVETGAPIEGAVMLAVWWRTCGIFGQECFVDAREGVTGADGRFEVPRLTGLHLGFHRRTTHLFAAGYVFDSEVVTPENGEPLVDPTVMRLRRLKTREELLKKSSSRPGRVPLEKMQEFTKAINVERKMFGADPLPLTIEGGK